MRFLPTDPPDEVLSHYACLLVVQMQRLEDLPAIAGEALARGVDSPALRQLAGTSIPDNQEARDLFESACAELGIAMPTPEEARWRLAYEWAAAIVSGELTPIEGARRIWWDAWENLERPDALTPIVNFATEWEDDPKHQRKYEDNICREAVRLLAQPERHPMPDWRAANVTRSWSSWRSWARRWKHDMLVLVGTFAIFTIGASCLVAFKLRANRGGSWGENALFAMLVVGVMAAAVMTGGCWWAFVEDRSPRSRPRGR